MTLKAISIVVINRTMRPEKKQRSANRSSFAPRAVLLRMARKDNKQLLMKITMAKAAPSSINDDSVSAEILTDVNTIKQNPSRLAEVFKICGELLFLSLFITRIVGL
jgi:hypothetical protein